MRNQSAGQLGGFVRGGLWFCACNFFAAALFSQTCRVLPNTVASGTQIYEAVTCITADNGFIVNGADVTFQAGSYIHLGDHFGAQATFRGFIKPAVAPSAVSVTPNSGSGSAQTFSFTFSDPAGAVNIVNTTIDIGAVQSQSGACYVNYVRGQNLIYLADDSGNLGSSLVVGVSGTESNSQCTVDAGASSVTASGITLTLNLAVSFTAGFAGAKNVYMEAWNGALDSGWVQPGTWTVGVPTTISSISPTSGSVGTSVTITGTGFGNTQGSSTVKFNGTLAAVTSWSMTTIIAQVPAGATSGPIFVTVSGFQAQSATAFQVQVTGGPTITGVSPASGAPGTPVTITGANFGAAQGSSSVTFNGSNGVPTSWNASSITVPVPFLATTGNIVVTVNQIASNPWPFTVAPTITSLTPTSGHVWSTSVLISGRNFGAAKGKVTFNGAVVDPAKTTWSDTAITVSVVPCAATTGNVVVTRAADLVASNGSLFNVTTGAVGVQGVTPRAQSGDPAHRVQLLFLGDGYTQDQLQQYQSDVDAAVGALFSEVPFSTYQSYFNIWRVDVASAQCGGSHPDASPATTISNYFNSAYSCGARCISLNDALVQSTINSQLLLANGLHNRAVVVLVNDPEFGGAGNPGVATSYNGGPGDPRWLEGVKHELAHAFGLLADEYSNAGGSSPTAAPANVATSLAFIPWSVWITGSTAPQTTRTSGTYGDGSPCFVDDDIPGVYIGAYNPSYYRSTNDSKMNHLIHCDGTPVAFEEINTEQLITSMYRDMTFPDGPAQPPTTDVSVVKGLSVTFQPTVPINLNPEPRFQFTWSIDGNQVTQGSGAQFAQYQLDSGTLSTGMHTVAVAVQDITPMVKNVLDEVSLRGQVQWNLTVNCYSHVDVSYYTDERDELRWELINGNSASYYGYVPYECVDTHKETRTYDCAGNLVSTADIIVQTDCSQCSMNPPIEWDFGPYYVPDPILCASCEDLNLTCYDHWEEDRFQCSDNYSYADTHVTTSCACSCLH